MNPVTGSQYDYFIIWLESLNVQEMSDAFSRRREGWDGVAMGAHILFNIKK